MRLIDFFMQLIAYVVEFRNALPQCDADYPQVRGEIRRLLEQGEAMSQGAGCDPGQFDEARFIVCAWIDETLLASQWPDRQLWQHEQLQRVYYQTTDAGVEAFERLDALGQKQEVREVYCLCLALGFRGRYIGEEGGFLLEQLRTANLKLLWESPEGVPALKGLTLFPASLSDQPPAAAGIDQASFHLTPMSAVLFAVPVFMFAVMYLVYRYVLNGLVLPNL
jgi:type VI secretion system protein ImpK